MSWARFQASLSFTLSQEGGYDDDPNDPGGATNLGIEYSEWNAYKGSKQPPEPPSTLQQFRDDLTVQDVTPIYLKSYWEPCNCGNLPAPLDAATFDWAVNLGVSSACKHLQELLGMEADGVIGPETLAAIGAVDLDSLLSEYLQVRRDLYNQIAQDRPSDAVFLQGWLNRVEALQEAISAGRV